MRYVGRAVIKRRISRARAEHFGAIHYNWHKLFNSMHTNYFDVASLITRGLLKPAVGFSRANELRTFARSECDLRLPPAAKTRMIRDVNGDREQPRETRED